MWRNKKPVNEGDTVSWQHAYSQAVAKLVQQAEDQRAGVLRGQAMSLTPPQRDGETTSDWLDRVEKVRRYMQEGKTR